ncbi:MAG: hypothetical protein ACRC7R_00810 [Sarcina sp.]
MKNYACNKCGSVDVFIDDRGSQVALMCGDCGKWLKWVSKKELPLVERFIESNKDNDNNNESSIDIRLYENNKSRVAYKRLTIKEAKEILEILDIKWEQI